MGVIVEIIIDGAKKFGGEIVAGIFLALVFWIFPGLRKFFSRYKEPQNKDDTEAEIQKQLESSQREEKYLLQLRELLQHREEALKNTEEQTAEEIQQRADLQKQLETRKKFPAVPGSKEPSKYQKAGALFVIFIAALGSFVWMWSFVNKKSNNETQIVRQYREAAEKGDAEAQFIMGDLYCSAEA